MAIFPATHLIPAEALSFLGFNVALPEIYRSFLFADIHSSCFSRRKARLFLAQIPSFLVLN